MITNFVILLDNFRVFLYVYNLHSVWTIYIVSNLNLFRPKQSPAPRHTHQGINLTIMVEDSFTAITPFSNYLLHEGIEGKMKKNHIYYINIIATPLHKNQSPGVMKFNILIDPSLLIMTTFLISLFYAMFKMLLTYYINWFDCIWINVTHSTCFTYLSIVRNSYENTWKELHVHILVRYSKLV